MARKNAKLTQAELSKKTGIPQSTISTAEREGHGSGETPVYARACGVNVMWLAKGNGEMLDFEPNQPLASGFIAHSAIDIHSIRQGQPAAHEVVEALVALMSAIEPGRRDSVATLASGLARNPSDTLLADLLVKILEPEAFAQPGQRSA